MKIFANILLIVCAAGIGLGVGFALRKKPPSQDTESLVAISSSSAGSSEQSGRNAKRRAQAHTPDDSPLATKLERDLSMSRGVTRWLYWLEAVEKATPADFPRLARMAQGNASAIRLVTGRWVEFYPRHLFDTLVAASKDGSNLPVNELSRTLFNEWSKRDPQAVVDALNSLESVGPRGLWRVNVASTIVETDPELGLRLMSEWHIDNFGPRMNGVAKWAAANPRHAAEFALAHPAGYASDLTMQTIGKEWAKIDPRGALEFAAGISGKPGDQLADTALKAWAGQDLAGAANWLATTDARTLNRLSPAFVEVWAQQDAASALAWCQENLRGSSLAQAVGGVVKGVAGKDVTAGAALVASLSPSPARAEAAVAVAEEWFPKSLDRKPVPPEAITWLASLDENSARRTMDKVLWGWATSDPQSMAGFLASSSQTFSSSAYNLVARELGRKNPLEAIEWAGRLPDNRGLSAGAEVFADWRRAQAEAATKWLNDLPPSDPRQVHYLQVAIRNLAWDAQAAGQLAALTASERAIARNVIEDMSLSETRRARLLDALNTP